jgi:quercetin dioxygenase-like cupin family protein
LPAPNRLASKRFSQSTNDWNAFGTQSGHFWFYERVFDVELRMSSEQIAVILKSFETPDEVRVVQKGRFELVHLGGMTIGRATYEPGWKWSEHVGPSVGATRCNVEHVGLVLSGAATAAFDDGRIIELRAGELFYIPPIPHDSWVIGDQPYVSLHFLGAEKYAKA